MASGTSPVPGRKRSTVAPAPPNANTWRSLRFELEKSAAAPSTGMTTKSTIAPVPTIKDQNASPSRSRPRTRMPSSGNTVSAK